MSTQSKLERDFYYNYKEIKDMDKIKIKAIDGDFSVCKVKDYSKVNLDAEFCLKSVYLIATRDLSNLWLQFFLSQNQGFMRLFEKTVLK